MPGKTIQEYIERLDPEKALKEIAKAVKTLFPLLDQDSRLDFVVSLIGDAGTDLANVRPRDGLGAHDEHVLRSQARRDLEKPLGYSDGLVGLGRKLASVFSQSGQSLYSRHARPQHRCRHICRSQRRK